MFVSIRENIRLARWSNSGRRCCQFRYKPFIVLCGQGLFFNALGAFGYPLTTWGARVRYAPTKRVYVQAGAYNGDPKVKEGSRHGVDFSLRGPLFAIGELGLRWNYGQQDTGLARNLKIGGYYNGGTFPTTATVSDSQTLRNAHGLYGLYILGDQQVWRWRDEGHGRDRYMGIFGAFTAAPQQRINTVPYFADAGVAAYGPFQSRTRDFAALGIAYGSYNNAPQQAGVRATPLIPAPNNEETLEATYGYTIKRGLLLQPSLQYIIHPKGNASIPSTLPPNSRVPNAFALGMNIVANF